MANVPYVKIQPESDETVRASNERGRREVEFWAAHRDEYQARFPDEFVAITLEGKLVAHSSDLFEFDDLVSAANVPREGLYSNFLAKTIRFVL